MSNFIRSIGGTDYNVSAAKTVIEQFGTDGALLIAMDYMEVAEGAILEHGRNHEAFLAKIEVQISDGQSMVGVVFKSVMGAHVKVFVDGVEANNFLKELLKQSGSTKQEYLQ